jgi:DNA-directed RNA polymerase subunit K/omega
MSDNEDYSISNNSDQDSDEESVNEYKKTNFTAIKKPTISDYDGDDQDENEDIEDIDSEDDEVEEDDTNQQEDDDIIIDDEDVDITDDEDEEEDEDDESVDMEDNEDKNKTTNKSGGANKKTKREKPLAPTIQLDVGNNVNYEDEDDDDYDDNYLQKFDKEITKDYITNFHPECLNHNYDEIKALSKVTRDEFNIIIDPLHKTVPFLTKYERARILGQRAKQIECGARPLVKVPENIIDSYIIAELELEQKAIPFIIRRPIPSGGSEYWNLKDLEIITF